MSIGSATFRPGRGHPGGDGGEGDSTDGLRSGRTNLDSWPTLVVEAGDSESSLDLRNDLRWWFDISNYEVKIVLVKFDHNRHEIVLERWEEEGSNPRIGIATTRFRTSLQPVLQQTITITCDITTNPTSYNVVSGALVLKFSLLFLRDLGPGQRDVVIGIPELQDYADRVWSFVRD